MKFNCSNFKHTLLTLTLFTSAISATVPTLLSQSAKSEQLTRISTVEEVKHLSLNEDKQAISSSDGVKTAQIHSSNYPSQQLLDNNSHPMAFELIAAAPQVSEKNLERDDQQGGFIFKHTTQIEFTFAILIIVVGLIISERFREPQERKQKNDIAKSQSK